MKDAKAYDLPILTIVVDAAIQPRARSLDQGHVEELAEAYRTGEPVPPVVVWKLPDGKHKLSQGFHRIEAARRAGLTKIPCIIYTGSETKCLIDAMCSNQGHGLKRTRDDKRRAVAELLKVLPSETSDRAISEMARVDGKTVASVRSELRDVANDAIGNNATETSDVLTAPVRNSAPGPLEDENVRVGKDGVAQKKKSPKPASQQDVTPEEPAPVDAGTPAPEPVSLPTEETTSEEQPSTEPEPVVESKAAKKPTIATVLDGLGNQVPLSVRDTFGDPVLTKAVERCRAVHAELVSLENYVKNTLSPKGRYYPFAFCGDAIKTIREATDTVAGAMASLEAGVPFCVCPKCNEPGEGCHFCRNSGCLPKWKHENREQYGV